MLSNELRQLIASKAPEYVATKVADDARRASSDATRDRDVLATRTEQGLAANVVFAWLASTDGQELLAVMRETGLGRVPLDHDSSLFEDGRVELRARAKQWGNCERFASAEAYIAWAKDLCGDSGNNASLDTPLFALAAAVRSGTILDRIAEHLRNA